MIIWVGEWISYWNYWPNMGTNLLHFRWIYLITDLDAAAEFFVNICFMQNCGCLLYEVLQNANFDGEIKVISNTSPFSNQNLNALRTKSECIDRIWCAAHGLIYHLVNCFCLKVFSYKIAVGATLCQLDNRSRWSSFKSVHILAVNGPTLKSPTNKESPKEPTQPVG